MKVSNETHSFSFGVGPQTHAQCAKPFAQRSAFKPFSDYKKQNLTERDSSVSYTSSLSIPYNS